MPNDRRDGGINKAPGLRNNSWSHQFCCSAKNSRAYLILRMAVSTPLDFLIPQRKHLIIQMKKLSTKFK